MCRLQIVGYLEDIYFLSFSASKMIQIGLLSFALCVCMYSSDSCFTVNKEYVLRSSSLSE